MPRKKSIAHCEDMIAVSSFSSDAYDHKSLGVDQKHAHEAHPSTHDAMS